MAVRFDSDGEDYRSTLSLGLLTQYSVTCWTKISVDLNMISTVWMLCDGTTDDYLVCRTNADGTTLITDDDVSTQPAGVALVVGTWYFVGVAVNGTNGVFITRAASTGTFTTQTWTGGASNLTATTLVLGESIQGFRRYNGCITAVKVWSGVRLTDDELKAESHTVAPRRIGNLAAWYPLLRTETADYSANGRTLTGGVGATTEDGPGISWGHRPSGLYVPAVTAVIHDLAAAGLASSSGTADARTLYPLASEGVAASSGLAAANLLFPLASDGLATSSGVAALNTLGSMLANGPATASGTAEVLVAVVLATDGVATSSGVAALLTTGALDAMGLASSSGLGSLVSAVTLGAVAEAASDATAVAALEMPLLGDGAAASSGAAATQVEGGLAAAAVAASAGSASLQATGAVAGEGLASPAATGALTATWTLGGVGTAAPTGSADIVVGIGSTALAASSGSAALTLTITLGTAVGLAATTGDNELGVETLIGATAVGSSSGRAVLYIALPYIPGPTGAPGRGAGGDVFGPAGRTTAEGPDTGRTRA